MRRPLSGFVLFTALAALSACSAGSSPSPAEPVAAVEEGGDEGCGGGSHSRYSPFTVKLEEGPFEVVSFKDVGLMSEEPVASDPLLETIAESLSHKLGGDAGLSAQVQYSTEIMDPSNHCACESSHLYVDLWRVSTPAPGWGYSLWSGCGEDDQFAWRQVEAAAVGEGDLVELVEPLTRSIFKDLTDATARGCFRRSC